MSNVTLETLTRAEAHRKLLALGMPANVAADYLGDDPPFVARSMVSFAYPGAWPILEAYRRHCKSKAAIDPIDTVPVPVAAAADRLASGHVQRLRDGTWEWCHDGGFDNGVVTFSPATNAWLSEVVKDAGHSGLTEEQLDVLARAMPDVVDYERATPEQRRRTVLDVLAVHGPRPPILCPGPSCAKCQRPCIDAECRLAQSGITWSTAIKVAIALAPHGDVTAQAQTMMRIAGDAANKLYEAVTGILREGSETQVSTLPHLVQWFRNLKSEDDYDMSRDIEAGCLDLEGIIAALRAALDPAEAEAAAEATQTDAKIDPETARRLAAARAGRDSGDASLGADEPSPIERLAREFDRAAFKQGCGAINHDRGDCYRDAAKRMRAVAAEYLGLTEEQAGNVQSVRRRLGLTQERLGVEIGYRSETISRWENGREAVPRVVRLALIGLIASHGEHDANRGAK